MMEATSTSEMLVNFYQTTRRNNPEDSHLHTHHLENLKSHKLQRKQNIKIKNDYSEKAHYGTTTEK
jgi:hypothetical protein